MQAKEMIDDMMNNLHDWRGDTLKNIRRIILETDPEMIEEWKWMGTPVWSHGGIVCLANPFKDKVKVTFNDGASLQDPDGLFNNGLDGKKWRSIDLGKGDVLNEASFKSLVLGAVAYNLAKAKPEGKPRSSAKKKPAQ